MGVQLHIGCKACLSTVLFAIALACGGGGGNTSGQTQTVQGTYQDGPSAGASRAAITPILLQDGTVLIAGGIDNHGQTGSDAFRYSPNSTYAVPTGSLLESRDSYAACLLEDGRVLICGGEASDGGAVRASSELYDPSTGQFSPAAPMPRPRLGHKAVRLSNGWILVGGGSIAAASQDPGTFVYDPAKDTWYTGGDLSSTRFNPLVLALADGRILFAGGSDFIGHTLDTVDIFDPADGSVHAAGKLCVPRVGASGALLPDGKVLVVGGLPAYDSGATPSAELFDPITALFAPAAKPQFIHFHNPATLLPDGRILFTGSWKGPIPSLCSEIYDPSKGVFLRTGDRRMESTSPEALLLQNGKVLVLGGMPATPATELFDPELMTTVQ